MHIVTYKHKEMPSTLEEKFKVYINRILALKKKKLSLNFDEKKNIYLLPFIQLLDFDIFNPEIVHACQPGTYLLKRNDEPLMLAVYSDVVAKENVTVKDECDELLTYMAEYNIRCGFYANERVASFYVLSQDLDKKKYGCLATIRFDTFLSDATEIFDSSIIAHTKHLYPFLKNQFNLDSILKDYFTRSLTAKIRMDLKAPSDNFIKYYSELTYKMFYNTDFDIKEHDLFVGYVKDALRRIYQDIEISKDKSFQPR